jgi:hypothetical protein
MQWRFWKRGSKKGKPVLPAAGDPTVEHSSSLLPPLARGSATELLGLQKLIGNQAVLRMCTQSRREGKIGRTRA